MIDPNTIAGLVWLVLMLLPPAMLVESVLTTRRFLAADRRYRALVAANIRQRRNSPAALDDLANNIDPEKTP